jgi:hypothetical protein
MQRSLKLSILALTISIVVTLLLYILVVQSPYILGVGCVLGVYLAKISSLKSAVFHGAIVLLSLWRSISISSVVQILVFHQLYLVKVPLFLSLRSWEGYWDLYMYGSEIG